MLEQKETTFFISNDTSFSGGCCYSYICPVIYELDITHYSLKTF